MSDSANLRTSLELSSLETFPSNHKDKQMK